MAIFGSLPAARVSLSSIKQAFDTRAQKLAFRRTRLLLCSKTAIPIFGSAPKERVLISGIAIPQAGNSTIAFRHCTITSGTLQKIHRAGYGLELKRASFAMKTGSLPKYKSPVLRTLP